MTALRRTTYMASHTKLPENNYFHRYEPPLKVTIPRPTEIPRARGVMSTGKYGGNLRIRCTNAEYDMAKEIADSLGLTLAGFGRWCIVRCAMALKEHRDNESDNIEADGA